MYLIFFYKYFRDNLKDSIKNTRRIIVDELGIDWCTDDDVTTLKYICEILSIRMGLLASIGERNASLYHKRFKTAFLIIFKLDVSNLNDL